MTKFKAVSLLVLAGLLWSLNGIVIKSVTWHPISIAGGLSLFAAVLQSTYLRRIPPCTTTAVRLGILLYAANTLLFVSAMQLTTVANTLLLQSSSPVYVALLGAATLKEPARMKDWGCVGIVLIGTWLFFFDELSAPQFLGTCLAVLSGLSSAGYAICLRSQKDASPLDIVIWGNIVVFVLSLPFLVSEPMSSENVCLVVVLGVVLYGLSFIAYCEAMKHVRAIEALILGTLELILGPVWAYLLLTEYPGPNAILGGSLIFSVVFWYSLSVIRRGSDKRH